MERFFIIDGMAIAYRAYFAFINRPLINSKGMNTSAIFGFVNTLEKILGEEHPEHIAVAFDTAEPTFRHKRFEAYKATREKMPDDMVEQLPLLKQLVRAYSIPVLEIPGWEADDIIGTLARRAERENIDCFLVTPDKDFMQLVTEHVKLYKPGKRADTWEIIDIEGVREKFGVRPDQVIDVLGLMGDQSDNIPGVKGIGEKTAIPLVQEFGSIPEIYSNLDRIGKKGVRDKLEAQQAEAELSRELVTIDINAPVEIDPLDLRRSEKNTAELHSLFKELEFSRHLQKLDEEQQGVISADEEQPETIESVAHDYVLVRTSGQLADMIATIQEAKEFCVDTETSGRSPMQSELVGLSFAVRPGHAWYVPTNAELPRKDIITALRPLFASDAMLIGQNLKFDLLVLRRQGIESTQQLYDTMLAAYVFRPEGDHSMNALAIQHLNYQPIPISRLIGKGKEQRSMADLPAEDIAEYAAEDADIALRLAHALRREITGTKQKDLLKEVEFP
ncbi:MAG: DNA polymerase I, partial [Bacteroidetes bacterium]|nr:DNA polymerase I [Bacteroidota bacterium]